MVGATFASIVGAEHGTVMAGDFREPVEFLSPPFYARGERFGVPIVTDAGR
jgi:hypothetical protein